VSDVSSHRSAMAGRHPHYLDPTQGPVQRMPAEQYGAHPQDGGPAWIASMMAASVSG